MFEQDRFIVRLRQRLLSEPQIVAAWLSGSYAQDSVSPYSDIVVALLFESDAIREQRWNERAEFCQSILAYVPARSVDGSAGYEHNTLFANGSLVRYRFESVESLQPKFEDRQIKILKDTPDERAAAQQRQSQSLQIGTRPANARELRQLDDRFWVGFWDVYRQLRGGTVDAPFVGYLRLLAETLPPLLTWLPAEHPARQQLIDVQYSLDARQTLTQLRRLLDSYCRARDAVAERNKLDFVVDRAFERQIERALAR